MTIPLDPALYEDLTPSAAQTIAAALGQSLGAYGANQLKTYQTGNALQSVGLSRDIARLPKNIQDKLVKAYLDQQQINNALSQYQNIDPYALNEPIPQTISDFDNGIVQPNQTLQPIQPTGQQDVAVSETTQETGPIDLKRPAMPYIFKQQDKINRTSQALSLINPNLAESFRKGEEEKLKIFKEQAKQEFTRLQPILKELDKEKGQYAIKKNALDSLESSIRRGSSGFSLDYLADKFGLEWLRSPEAAEFITASKEFFLGSLARAGSRPNQWIEQQLRTFLPQLGRSQEANLVVTEILRTNLEIDRARANFINQVMQEDYEQFGLLRPNVQERAEQRLDAYADAAKADLERRVANVIFDNPNPENSILVDEHGNTYNLSPEQVPGALKKGLKLYGDT
jgi:hypothetical protein